MSNALLGVTAGAKGLVAAGVLLVEKAGGRELEAELLPKGVEIDEKGLAKGADFCPPGTPNTLGVCSEARPELAN